MEMEERSTGQAPHKVGQRIRGLARPADSFGLVLILLVLDYVAVSAITDNAWGRVVIVVLLGATLLFALRTSHAHRIWQLVAALYLVGSTIITIASILVPSAVEVSRQTSLVGGILLVITPVAISRRILAQRFISTETVLGALCVYLLIGFSFTFIYSGVAFVSGTPFFVGLSQATSSDYLFFSYSTLTTVGYGNLVPVGSVGQTLAMLEALFGQIYLVIVVARLVSLWGQERPAPPPKRGPNEQKSGATSQEPDPSAHTP
ncbi:MAG TPA: potassium channel family protein [Ktedonobacterales bacterium]